MLVLGFGVALALWCIGRDAAFLWSSPYPYGVDGYYYAALADWNVDAPVGRTASPLPWLLLRALSLALDPASATKTFGLVVLYLTGLVLAAIGYRLTRSYALALLAFFLIVRGFMRAELLVNFHKQSLGQLWMGVAVLALLWDRTRPGRMRMGIVAAALAACAATHTLAAVIALMFVVSHVVLHLCSRAPIRGPLSWYAGVAAVAMWFAVAVLGALPPEARRASGTLGGSTSLWPRFNIPLLYDSLSPVAWFVPVSFVTTLALSVVVVAWWRAARRAELRRVRACTTYRLCAAACAFVPQLALTVAPFWIGANVQPLGLHFRLVCALGVVAAVVVPVTIALACRRYRGAIACVIVALLAIPPPAWSASVRPPNDDGALHRAMVAAAPDIPRDAVILTSLRMGNMVTYLWKRPRVVESRVPVDLARAKYYRFTVLEPEAAERLMAFAELESPPVEPRPVLGPWWLIEEGFYRQFAERLQTEAPELAERLVN